MWRNSIMNDHTLSTNVTSISQGSRAISLDDVVKEIKNWRAHKKIRGEKIPENIWDHVFTLLQTLSASEVLPALGISREQLTQEQKMRERLATASVEKPSVINKEAPVQFCEATPSFPLEHKPAKAFSTNTSVVELYRRDGMLMRIHICTERFDELLRAFFSGDTA